VQKVDDGWPCCRNVTLFCRRMTIVHNVSNTLQHTATNCNRSRTARRHCNTLQRTATHCNTAGRHEDMQRALLQRAYHAATRSCMFHTSLHCDTLQHNATGAGKQGDAPMRLSCCNKLLYISHCNTLQHSATHCNTLQHSATGAGKQGDKR